MKVLSQQQPNIAQKSSLDQIRAKRLHEADQVAKDFENVFVEMLMKSMRNTVGSTDKTNAMEIYEGMLDSEYSQAMTSARDFGIRSMIVDWIKQNDPVLSNPQGAAASSEPIDAKQLGTKRVSIQEALDQYRAQSVRSMTK